MERAEKVAVKSIKRLGCMYSVPSWADTGHVGTDQFSGLSKF